MSFFESPAALSGSNSYFAAMNTHRGFVSLFTELFDGYSKNIIKGGPGTGKSSLMKKIAAEAQSMGIVCNKYYCSSDTRSLDAVALPQLGKVFLDGTAPHMTDPKYPGASDSIINLGEYWDVGMLRRHTDEIVRLTDSISGEYKRVYALLASAKGAEDAYDLRAAEIFDPKAASEVSKKLIKKHRPQKAGGKVTSKQVCAFGVHGSVCFDSLFEDSQTAYILRDRLCLSHNFFEILCRELLEYGADIEISRIPADEKICSVRIPSCSLLISLPLGSERTGRTLNTERFVNERGAGKIKSELRASAHIGKLAEKEAARILSSIGEMHDELEKYYIEAMDFEKIDDLGTNICSDLFGTPRL